MPDPLLVRTHASVVETLATMTARAAGTVDRRRPGSCTRSRSTILSCGPARFGLTTQSRRRARR